MFRLVVGLSLAVLCLSSVTGAFATVQAVGDPIEGGSWSQAWTESGVGTFNLMEFYWIYGGKLEGLSISSPGTWTTFLLGASAPPTSPQTWSTGGAQGPGTTSSAFTMKYFGASSTPLAYDLTAWRLDGGQYSLVDSARASWSGSAWSIASLPLSGAGAYSSPKSVPELPPTLLACALPMFGLVLSRFRRR